MSHPTLFFHPPRPRVDIAEVPPAVSHAGAVLLTDTVAATGLTGGVAGGVGAVDETVGRAPRGEGAAGPGDDSRRGRGGERPRYRSAAVRTGTVRGAVASSPTISRMLTTLAEDAPAVMAAISRARRTTRERAWALAGEHSPVAGTSAKDPLVIDLDATLITAHSEKEQAAPTFKKGFGYHPLCAFVDHGSEGGTGGEPLAIQLRPGNAGSNTAADHITVTQAALAQLPPTCWEGGWSWLEEDLDPHRRSRRHQGLPPVADRAAVGLLGRIHPPPRQHSRAADTPR